MYEKLKNKTLEEIVEERFNDFKNSINYYCELSELYYDCAYDFFFNIHKPTLIEFMNMENSFKEMEIDYYTRYFFEDVECFFDDNKFNEINISIEDYFGNSETELNIKIIDNEEYVISLNPSISKHNIADIEPTNYGVDTVRLQKITQ